MDIKLRAKLSAHALVDTFEPTDSEHNCKLMTPITINQIDNLFSNSCDTEEPTPNDSFINFVNSLFTEDNNV